MSDDKYIAFDVHQATTVASVLNAAGREVNTGIVPTQAQPLIGFLEGLQGKLHLSFEEGTYAAWLYDLLQERVAELVVCDPRHNALLKEGNKTDAGDARKLAELLRAGMLRAVYHGSRSLRSLQELAHSYEVLRDDTTRVMNRIKAFYRGRGIDPAGQGCMRKGNGRAGSGVCQRERAGCAASCCMMNSTSFVACEGRRGGRCWRRAASTRWRRAWGRSRDWGRCAWPC